MTGPLSTGTGALDRTHGENEPTTTPAEPTEEPFIRRLQRLARPVDLAVLLAVPAVLAAAALLPVETRLEMAFSYADPTLRSAFVSTFVHFGTDHLLFNLAAYGFVVPTVYLLSVLSGDRDRFYVAFVSFLVIFPVALSFLNLAVPREGVSLGFSGVNMAFVGYLPVALGGYLRQHFGVRAEHAVASGLFFAGLALVAVLAVRMPVTYAVAAVAALAALVHLRSAGIGLPTSLPSLGPAGYAELGAVAVLFFGGGLVGAFPLDLTVGGAVVNVYVHFLGYALGFISTYVTFQVAPVLERAPLVAAVRDLTVSVLPGLTAS